MAVEEVASTAAMVAAIAAVERAVAWEAGEVGLAAEKEVAAGANPGDTAVATAEGAMVEGEDGGEGGGAGEAVKEVVTEGATAGVATEVVVMEAVTTVAGTVGVAKGRWRRRR